MLRASTPDSRATPPIASPRAGTPAPYFDFARGTRVFGEPVLYLAALFILSDAVRYRPQKITFVFTGPDQS